MLLRILGRPYCHGYGIYNPNPDPEENLIDLDRQYSDLNNFFPHLSMEYDKDFLERIRKGEVEKPKRAERWALILDWRIFNAETYGEAVQQVLEVLKKTRLGRFKNNCAGKLGSSYLRQHPLTIQRMQKLAEQQTGHNGILIVPVQLGLRYRGYSVHHVRKRIFPRRGEFGLGLFHAASLLLTHRERFQKNSDLWLECAGDEYSSMRMRSDGEFPMIPHFRFFNGELLLNAASARDAVGYCGAASGFIV